MKGFLRDESGFSLMEIVVAAGMFGLLSLAVIEGISQYNITKREADQDVEIIQFSNSLIGLIENKAACESTLANNGPLDPTGAGSTFNEIRNADGVVVYSVDDIIGVSAASETTGGKLRISEFRISNYNDPGNNLINTEIREAIISVTLVPAQTSGTTHLKDLIDDFPDEDERPRHVLATVRRFKVEVVVNGTPDITGCITAEDRTREALCHQLGGVFDILGAAPRRCKGILLEQYGNSYGGGPVAGNSALLAPDLANPANADNYIAIKASGDVRVSSGTAVEGSVVVGQITSPVAAGEGSVIATNQIVGHNGFMKVGDSSFTWSNASNPPTNSILIENRLGVNSDPVSVPSDGGVDVVGNIQLGRAKTYGTSPTQGNNNYGATTGFVQNWISYYLGGAATVSAIMADVYNLDTEPEAGNSVKRQACDGLSYQDETGTFSGVYSGGVCTITNTISTTTGNCEVENCTNVHGNTIYIGGSPLNAWDDLL